MKTKYIHPLTAIFLFLSMALSVNLMAADSASTANADPDDIMAMLTKELKLSDDQSKKLGAEIQKFAKTVDQLKTDQEKEGAEPDDLVKGARKAQEEYLDQVKKILTPDQYKQYEALKEKALKGMFEDLAAIKLMDIQSRIDITDDQLDKLAPIMGDSLYQVVTLAWQHAGQRLRIGQKIKLARELKHIQKEAREASSKILSKDQMDAWDKLKEEQQKKNK